MRYLPNALSLSRVVLTPVFFVLYMMEDPIWRSISLVVYTIAALTDYFDGHYARKYGVESSLGIFLDPLADKILTIAAFCVLPVIEPGIFPWWPILLIVGRDIFVTGMRVLADQRGMVMKTSYSAKVKTFIQMGFLYVALLSGFLATLPMVLGEWTRVFLDWGVLTWLLYVVALVTVYTGLEYVNDNRGLFRRGRA